jgi:hypothetical protein
MTPQFNRSTAFTSVSFEDNGLLVRCCGIGGSSSSNFRRATPWAETEEGYEKEGTDGLPLLDADFDFAGTPNAPVNEEKVININDLYEGLALPESKATSTHPISLATKSTTPLVVAGSIGNALFLCLIIAWLSSWPSTAKRSGLKPIQ